MALEGWAALSPNGTVRWKPPALYRSRCPIRVRGGPGGGVRGDLGSGGFGVWGIWGLGGDLRWPWMVWGGPRDLRGVLGGGLGSWPLFFAPSFTAPPINCPH